MRNRYNIPVIDINNSLGSLDNYIYRGYFLRLRSIEYYYYGIKLEFELG